MTDPHPMTEFEPGILRLAIRHDDDCPVAENLLASAAERVLARNAINWLRPVPCLKG